MLRPLRVSALLALLATPFLASAQSSGTPFSLTNSRYGASIGAQPMLRSNGRDLVLFSMDNGGLLASKLVSGQDRAGDQVFDTGWPFDVEWTGRHFFAVAQVNSDSAVLGEIDPEARIVGRRVDRAGHPLGTPFTIVPNAISPRIAAGHGAVLLIYTHAQTRETHAMLLGPDGQGGTSIKLQSGGEPIATSSGFMLVSARPQQIAAMMLDARGNFITDRTISTTAGVTSVAAATKGDDSLAVWKKEGEIGVALVSSDGTPGAPLILDMTGVVAHGSAPSAVWNGAGWTVLYDTVQNQSFRLRAAHLDANAQRVLHREEGPPHTTQHSLTLLGTRTVAAWSATRHRSIVSDLPFAQNTPRIASFGATGQWLYATTSSPTATFVAWDETGTDVESSRVGVRTHDGEWNERELPGVSFDGSRMVAASDGRNFLLTMDKRAWLFDESATLLRELTLPRYVRFAAWTGAKYVLFTDAGTRTLSPSGEISEPINLPVSFIVTSAASNGDGFVVAGSTTCATPCQWVGVRATRLTRDLARVDAKDMVFDDGSLPYGVVWDGTEYVVAWNSESETSIARFAATANAEPRVQQIANADFAPIAIAAMNDGDIALLGLSDYHTSHSLMFVRRDGALTSKKDVVRTAYQSQPFGVLPLRDGAIAFVAQAYSDGAPHHGMQRLMMTTFTRDIPLSPPAAPQLDVQANDTRFLVGWTAPAGTVNGYRLEHRIDDGVWIELERWFGPGEQTASILRPSYGTTFAFRVRALNDAGPGAYSNVVTKHANTKRRALR